MSEPDGLPADRRVTNTPPVRKRRVRRPFFPTLVWAMITGGSATLAAVTGLVFGWRVGVPALLWCLAAGVFMIRSPYRWRRWHESVAADEDTPTSDPRR